MEFYFFGSQINEYIFKTVNFYTYYMYLYIYSYISNRSLRRCALLRNLLSGLNADHSVPFDHRALAPKPASGSLYSTVNSLFPLSEVFFTLPLSIPHSFLHAFYSSFKSQWKSLFLRNQVISSHYCPTAHYAPPSQHLAKLKLTICASLYLILLASTRL